MLKSIVMTALLLAPSLVQGATISSRDTIPTMADNDVVAIIDVSDTTESVNGTGKKTTNAGIKGYVAESGLGTVQLTPQAAPAHSEGLYYYDQDKDALTYYNGESDVAVNLGQEGIIPVRNISGSTIANGSVVYPSGGDSSQVTIGLADAHVTSKSRLVGVATHSIENNTNGYVTRFGEVGGLNTSAYSAGDVLYLSDTTPGALTDTQPTDGSYIVVVGVVKVVSATVGTIVVDPTIADTTVEVTDTNGFPPDQRTATTLSFVDGTRTFSITPTGTEFHYYIEGIKYEKTSAESVVIDNTEGLHVIYYDGETLTAVANPNAGQVDTVIRAKSIVSYLYWDATNSEVSYFGDERHGISMSPNTHAYLHFTRGAQYLSGLTLDTFSVGGTGDVTADAQFGIVAGAITDEDVYTGISTIASTAGLPIYYLSGANGDLRRVTQAGYPVYSTGSANGRLYYNEWTGTVWQLTEITNNDFVLYHIFAINGISGEDQVVAIMGQEDYGNLSQARAGANDEIANVLIKFPFEEAVPLGTVIYQTSDSYDNAVQARVVSTDTGDDYVSWLTTELAQGVAPTSHSNLSNLELAASGSTWGHINDQAQTIAGVKTYSSSPIVPTPTTDYQASTKKYADDGLALKEPLKGADDNFVTDAEKIVIGNTSGTNTGDDPASDTAYDATSWDGNPAAATKNAIRDKIETLGDSGEANETMDSTPINGNTDHTVSSDGIYDALALKAPIDAPVFTTSITAPVYLSSASDGGRYVGASNTVTLTSTATLGHLSFLTDRWWLANGTNWTSRYLFDSSMTIPEANIHTDIARDSELPTAAGLSVDDLITLSGVAGGATDYGTFTGATIPNSSTAKAAMQALETAVEGVGGHDAVTIGSTANGLSLSTQQLSLAAATNTTAGAATAAQIAALEAIDTEAEIEALLELQDLQGAVTDVQVPDDITITGNAGSATVLETARTIGGVSFNGSANISLPGVNATGNQDTSGNAATATLATTATTANAGDSATGFFSSGTIEAARLPSTVVQDTDIVSANTNVIEWLIDPAPDSAETAPASGMTFMIPTGVDYDEATVSCDDTTTGLVITIAAASTRYGTYSPEFTMPTITSEADVDVSSYGSLTAGEYIAAWVSTAVTGDATECTLHLKLTNN